MQNLASGLVDFIVQRIAGAHSYRELMQFYADQYVYVLMLSVRQAGDTAVVAERLLKSWRSCGASSGMRIDITSGVPDPIV